MAQPRELFGTLWHEGEACCLFADTNSGKSVLAVQIGNEVATVLEKKVLYFDFEMSHKQFQMHYTIARTHNGLEFVSCQGLFTERQMLCPDGSSERRERILELHRQGLSQNSIVEQVGGSKSTVNKIIRESGEA